MNSERDEQTKIWTLRTIKFMMTGNKSMNNPNETQETKHLGDTEEVAQRWEKITKIFEAASALTGKVFEKVVRR